MDAVNFNVALVLFQYSVIVKGFEKKLKEMGYGVEVLSEDFDRIEGLANRSGAFVFYLPVNIAKSKLQLEQLHRMLNTVSAQNRGVILIGEANEQDEIIRNLPETINCSWFSRPVDMETFSKSIREILEHPEASSNRKRILIVDDDPSYESLVREWIKGSYKTDIVTAGMQAITFLLKNHVDLILLDHDMPICDGPQVLQMLRQDDTTKDIPVVFLTGNGTKEAVSRVMALKPAGYILKSTSKIELIAYLQSKLK